MALLPHGLVGDAVVYTNHDRISSVVFEGYSDEDDVALMATIEEVLPLMDIEKGDTEPQIDTW